MADIIVSFTIPETVVAKLPQALIGNDDEETKKNIEIFVGMKLEELITAFILNGAIETLQQTVDSEKEEIKQVFEQARESK